MLFEEIALALAKCFFVPAIGRGMVVVEPCFTNADDAVIAGVCLDDSNGIVRRIVHIAGVDANADADAGIGVGNRQVGIDIIEAGGKGDHFLHSEHAGSGDDVAELARIEFV